jgi:hypothetical protein
MKIIKQNDNAGGLIFKQNTAGKAMKQNYNFGKSWRGQSSTTIYINIPSLSGFTSINSSFSFLCFEKISTNLTTVGSMGFFIDTQNGIRFGPNGSRTLYTIDVRKANLNTNVLSKVTVPGQQVFAAYSQDVNGSLVLINGTTGSSTVFAAGNFNTFTISRELLNNRVSDSKYSVFCFYDIKIGYADMQYIYNSGLGNEPLNIFGLLYYYIFQIAEILDFSDNNYTYDPLNIPIDSDFKVGIRNYGSIQNGHGEILGLPIGSLEDQLNYANANLFESW